MYLYVHGNPFSLVDPTGLSGWPGLSTLLDWSYNRNAKLCQQVSDAGYPGVAKGLNTIQGAQHGLLRNPVGFVDGIYQAGAEVVGGLSTDVGLMSPQTYNEHSIIAPVVNSVADHGIAGTAAGMWQGAKDFGGKLASGDLDAWGDMSFAVGTGAVTAIKAPKVLETLSLIKKVESSEEVAKDVTNALKAVEGGTGAAGETHGPFFNGRGGRYDVLETGGGIERDHVPSQSTLRALGIDTDEGPARQLIRPDHWETPTWGRGAGPDAARAAELDLAKAGNWRQLYANSIKDLRKKTGSLYNSANKEMLEYAKQWKDLKKKEN